MWKYEITPTSKENIRIKEGCQLINRERKAEERKKKKTIIWQLSVDSSSKQAN